MARAKRRKRLKRPNGTGSIVYLKSGNRRKRYQAVLAANLNVSTGETTRTTLGFYETYEEAEAALNDFYGLGISVEDYKATFEDVYRAFYERQERKDLSKKAYECYTSAFNNSKVLHDKIFRELKLPQIQSVVDDLNAGVSSQKQIKNLLNLMYDFVIKSTGESLIKFSEYIEFDETKGKKTKRTPFSNDELKILWDNLDDPACQDILIMIYSGLRVDEYLNIEIENIHLDESYMIGGNKTDAGKKRIIPIFEELQPIIAERINANSKYLCEKNKNKKIPYHSFRKTMWDKAMEKYKMNHLPHDTKHTAASLMDNQNIKPIIKKLILGHSLKDLTERVYTHKDKDEILREYKKLGKYFV